MKIKNAYGNELTLTTTSIRQLYDGDVRYVLLADLKKYLPKENGTSTSDAHQVAATGKPYPKILRYKGGNYVSGTWLATELTGELSIGCQDFDLATTKKIFKAAGIRRTKTKAAKA